MKTVKSILSFALVLVILASALNITSIAEGIPDFQVEDGALINYYGKSIDVVIPDDLGITSIGTSAFHSHDTIRSITIPNSIVKIGDLAFAWCSSLTSITFGNSVTSMGDNVFANCYALKSINIPKGLKAVGRNAFGFCTSLESITIPNSVTTIGFAAFQGCTSLTTVIIPSSVTTIDDYAFTSGDKFTSITIPPSVTTFGKDVFRGCSNLIIYGISGSYIQTYAKQYGIPFKTEKAAAPTSSSVLVNGTAVAFEAYTIDGNNYFKLRDLAKVLSGTGKQFEVGWDGVNNAISLTTGKSYTTAGGELTKSGVTQAVTATLSNSKIYLNGKEISLTAYTVGGNNYFKLREVGAEIDFGVTWNGAINTIAIDTSTGYTE